MEFKNKYNCVCGSKEFYTKQNTKLNNGIQTGLYCSGCGRWIKWLGKEEVRLFEKYLEESKMEIEEDEFKNQFDISQVSNEELPEELARRIRKGNIN